MFVVGVANQVQGSDISVPPRTRQQGQEYRPKQQRDQAGAWQTRQRAGAQGFGGVDHLLTALLTLGKCGQACFSEKPTAKILICELPAEARAAPG